MAAEETEKTCAECGHPIWEGWMSFSTDPENPEKLVMKFGGHIRTPRKFRLPEDLGVFFHSSCAPEVGEKEGVEEVLLRNHEDGYETVIVRSKRTGQAMPPNQAAAD